MLGVQRPTVNVAARGLTRAGLIRFRHGVLTIVDREGLNASACEDYRLTNELFERMYGTSDPRKCDQMACAAVQSCSYLSRTDVPALIRFNNYLAADWQQIPKSGPFWLSGDARRQP